MLSNPGAFPCFKFLIAWRTSCSVIGSSSSGIWVTFPSELVSDWVSDCSSLPLSLIRAIFRYQERSGSDFAMCWYLCLAAWFSFVVLFGQYPKIYSYLVCCEHRFCTGVSFLWLSIYIQLSSILLKRFKARRASRFFVTHLRSNHLSVPVLNQIVRLMHSAACNTLSLNFLKADSTLVSRR